MKKKPLFTDEELKAMRLADEEIEKSFAMTPDDWERSKAMDKQARIDRLDNKGRKIAAQKAAYREANREKIAAQQAAYREANREKWNAYQRDYRRRKKLLAQQYEKETASEAGTFESGKGQKSTNTVSHPGRNVK